MVSSILGEECELRPPQGHIRRLVSHHARAWLCKKEGRKIMKTMKKVGYASIAGLALALLTPSLSMADSAFDRSGSSEGSTVHRISHDLAMNESYTLTSASGNRWGKEAVPTLRDSSWATEARAQGGNRWSHTPSETSQASSSDFAKKSGNRWRRSDNAEQAGNRWRRSDIAEQAGNRWRRSDIAEQAGNRWRRSDIAEQAGNRWRRSDFAEQAGNRWRR